MISYLSRSVLFLQLKLFPTQRNTKTNKRNKKKMKKKKKQIKVNKEVKVRECDSHFALVSCTPTDCVTNGNGNECLVLVVTFSPLECSLRELLCFLLLFSFFSFLLYTSKRVPGIGMSMSVKLTIRQH